MGNFDCVFFFALERINFSIFIVVFNTNKTVLVSVICEPSHVYGLDIYFSALTKKFPQLQNKALNNANRGFRQNKDAGVQESLKWNISDIYNRLTNCRLCNWCSQWYNIIQQWLVWPPNARWDVSAWTEKKMGIVTPKKKATNAESCFGTYKGSLLYKIDQWRDNNRRLCVSLRSCLVLSLSLCFRKYDFSCPSFSYVQHVFLRESAFVTSLRRRFTRNVLLELSRQRHCWKRACVTCEGIQIYPRHWTSKSV